MTASRGLRATAFAAVVFALAATVYSAYEQALTTDEPYHLAYSRQLWIEREDDRTSLMHFDSKTPVMLANVVLRRAARGFLGVADPGLLKLAARLPTVGWLALLIVTSAAVASRLAGPNAGALAAIAVAVDPNLIAHASLATVDVAYALGTLASLALAWRFAQRPGWASGGQLGLALAFAFASKLTALLLVAGVAVAVVQALAVGTPGGGARLRSVAAGLACLAAAFCLATCASYLFVDVGSPLGELAPAFPRLRLPLPAGFLAGLETVSRREATKEFPVLLLDRHYPRGVFFYFAVCWALKTPLALIAFQVSGFAALARDRALANSGELRFYLFNLTLTLVFFSFFFRTQVGYRFVLMCLPLAACVAAAGLARSLPARRSEQVALVLLTLAVAEQWPYLGNHLAFTNAFVQPKNQAFHYLADSNLDWHQNDDKLEGWRVATRRTGVPLNAPNPVPGDNIYQVAALGARRYDGIRRSLQPLDHFRHTFLLFHLTPDDFHRYLAVERRFEPDPQAATACGSEPRHPPTDEERIVTEGAERTVLVCFESPKPVEIALECERGSALFGPLDRPRTLWDIIGVGQSSQLRLEPGLHAFGVDRGFGFNARLRAPADGLLWSFTRQTLPQVAVRMNARSAED